MDSMPLEKNTRKMEQGIVPYYNCSQFPTQENYTAHTCPFEFRNIYVACFAANGSGSMCVVCLGSFPIVLRTPPDVQMEAALSATTYQ